MIRGIETEREKKMRQIISLNEWRRQVLRDATLDPKQVKRLLSAVWIYPKETL